MTIYQIQADILEALEANDDGEIDPQRLYDLEMTLAEKAEAVIKFVRNLESSAEAKKAEARRLLESANADQARADDLTDYLKRTMESLSLTRLDAGLFRLKIQLNGGKPAVSFEGSVDDLPDWLKSVKTTVSLNRGAALEAFEAGGSLPEGVRVERGTSLRVS